MKWSWKIARIDGVELRIHLTFLVLIAWLAVSYWITGKSLHSMVSGVGFILALFACVMLHEFGHVLAARQFGIGTRDITLLPIGGLARLERMPEVPSHEAWIAAAGPAVNLAIAAVLDSWLTFMDTWQPFSQLHLTTGPWLERLLVANVTLVIFNLIPAFPMDGGRILRALLSSRIGHTRGAEVAASVGQVFAFVMGLIGLFVSPMLLLIGLRLPNETSAPARRIGLLAPAPGMLQSYRSWTTKIIPSIVTWASCARCMPANGSSGRLPGMPFPSRRCPPARPITSFMMN
jgi:Zn-dependent protease